MHFAFLGTKKTHACTRAKSRISTPTKKFRLWIGKFWVGGGGGDAPLVNSVMVVQRSGATNDSSAPDHRLLRRHCSRVKLVHQQRQCDDDDDDDDHDHDHHHNNNKN